MLSVAEQWIIANLWLLLAGVSGSVVYFMRSDESPLIRKVCSTIIGFIISLTFSPAIFKYLHVEELEYQCAIVAILALGGRWASETIMLLARKFIGDKFGV